MPAFVLWNDSRDGVAEPRFDRPRLHFVAERSAVRRDEDRVDLPHLGVVQCRHSHLVFGVQSLAPVLSHRRQPNPADRLVTRVVRVAGALALEMGIGQAQIGRLL